MDILQYTPAHEEFRKRLSDFLEKEVAPVKDQHDADHMTPKSIWKRFGEEGFLCTNLSKEYGALGGDFLYSVIVCEEVSRTGHSGLAVSLHSDIVVPYINAYGSDEIKKKYLPGCVSGDIITAVAMTEPGAGSDLASLEATAVEDGDEIVINGAKTFISNGLNADLVIVAARDPEISNPYEAISLYLVEDGMEGFGRGRHLDKMGMHAQDTAELFFSNCRIPKENILGQKGSGFLMLMEKLQQERLVASLMAVAAAELALEWITDYCQKTTVNGKPLSKFQANQFALVEMATDVKLGRTFLDNLIHDHAAGENVIIETSMAKFWTTDMVHRICDRALDLMGPDAMNDKAEPVQAWRDTRIMSIFAGSNEIMKIVAGRFMGL